MKGKTKAVLGVIAALLIGGLGNGIWEYILEPVFAGGASLGLSIATLGVESFKDGIYLSIAKGFHEEHSLAASTFISLFATYAMVFGLFIMTRMSKLLIEKMEKSRNDIEELEAELESDGEKETKLNLEGNRNNFRKRIASVKIETETQKVRFRLLHKVNIAMFALSIALFAWSIINTVKVRYINSAIAHFEQSLTIVSPHAKPDELIFIRSKFAQINKRDDFIIVLKEIDQVGARGNLELNAFEVW